MTKISYAIISFTSAYKTSRSIDEHYIFLSVLSIPKVSWFTSLTEVIYIKTLLNLSFYRVWYFLWMFCLANQIAGARLHLGIYGS